MYIARTDNADKSINQTKFIYPGYLNISVFDVIYESHIRNILFTIS